jgi:hypothetical protein
VCDHEGGPNVATHLYVRNREGHSHLCITFLLFRAEMHFSSTSWVARVTAIGTHWSIGGLGSLRLALDESRSLRPPVNDKSEEVSESADLICPVILKHETTFRC